ncbi:competence protein ComEA [Methylococcaceae bacterium CS1]|nr:competence protein ComEA [Methylococcaceae bacterium CS4]TXK97785.1 competence protein ComEA [Methylococcaceae bacterium CS5]TXL05773.1 competence protein ComEA [Methylococcaceae bacterium CS1]TXL08126.1 competence protein ComEA [Methylococcaceae bacterium CS3]TXL10305.1 competence protein ComEA [Methylococcaceae bacterium CS2]TXL12544.1 competence protein ComEA [Methylococcaceae bacterium HT3]
MKKLIVLLMFLSFSVFAEPVNINKASADEIAASLNGVGDKKAQEIVKYRETQGPFKSANELVNVKGIGDKTIAKNKGNIKIGSISNAFFCHL